MARKKITFIGAGSVAFTRNLVRDILTFPAFRDCELALMDVNEDNLNEARILAEAIVKAGNYPAIITCHTDRASALEGANGVLTTIAAGGVEAEYRDMKIMKDHGISLSVGDTRGPTGVFRFLRHFPPLMDIVHDMEKYCPGAILLNYTNPMAMLCRALQEKSTKITVTGLCHSVQGTASMLAAWIGAPIEEITYLCAGINHQAHYLKFEWNGQDAYPLIRKALAENEAWMIEEPVRNEMFLQLGYYVTESSGHNSEYNPWFRKRPDLLEKYCLQYTTMKKPRWGWNPGGDWITNYEKRIAENPDWYTGGRRRMEFGQWVNGEIDLNRGWEYATYIFNAIFGDNTPFKFNGNVRNFGLIDNLPEGCCVEVPVLASKDGIEPIHVGALPPQLAQLNNISARNEEMAVIGALTGNKEMIYHACLFDPLTSAHLSMGEIREVVNQLFEANKDFLGYYNFK